MVFTNAKKIDTKLLVFEYYTASGINDPKIISEAVALIKALLNDLRSYSSGNELNVHFLVSKKFTDIGDEYGFKENNASKIIIDTKLENWLEKNVSDFDSCIFISAEENMNLYNLTKIMEKNNVKIYGSDSDSTLLCSNKYSTFKHLQGLVNQPKTSRFTIHKEKHWKIPIKKMLKLSDNNNEFKLIVKPIHGVNCQNMLIISDEKDIAKISETYKENSEILVQEFIQGEHLSVSLISDGKTAIPLTLNKQYLEINKENQQYLGGKLPYDHYRKKTAFTIAKKAVESIKGIKGFVGVDLILKKYDDSNTSDNNPQKDLYILEINSRFTTPYIGLSKITKFNIGKTIIKLLDNKIDINSINDNNISSKYVKFKKKAHNLDIEIL